MLIRSRPYRSLSHPTRRPATAAANVRRRLCSEAFQSSRSSDDDAVHSVERQTMLVASLWWRLSARMGTIIPTLTLDSVTNCPEYHTPIHVEDRQVRALKRKIQLQRIVYGGIAIGLMVGMLGYGVRFLAQVSVEFVLLGALVSDLLLWWARAVKPMRTLAAVTLRGTTTAPQYYLPLKLAFVIQKVEERVALLHWMLGQPQRNQTMTLDLRKQSEQVLPKMAAEARAVLRDICVGSFQSRRRGSDTVSCDVDLDVMASITKIHEIENWIERLSNALAVSDLWIEGISTETLQTLLSNDFKIA